VALYSDAPYGYEFALALPEAASTVVEALTRKKIIAGLPVGRWYAGLDNVLLVACTEKTTPEHIDGLAVALAAALAGEVE
jgi:glycine dehydrogenase subunit 1